MKIKIKGIESAMSSIINKLLDSGLHEIEIEEDFYWIIQKKDIYNPYKQPSNLTLGQLSSDWENVQKISSGENPPISYGLVWISSIARNIGEKIVR